MILLTQNGSERSNPLSPLHCSSQAKQTPARQQTWVRPLLVSPLAHGPSDPTLSQPPVIASTPQFDLGQSGGLVRNTRGAKCMMLWGVAQATSTVMTTESVFVKARGLKFRPCGRTDSAQFQCTPASGNSNARLGR